MAFEDVELREYHGAKTITRLPKMIGELFFGISGNNYLFYYRSKLPGELFFGPFRQF